MTIAEISPQDEITVAAIRGDDDAFAALYDLLSPRVFNFVLRSVHERSTAEDICQEVWLKAHREIRMLKSPQALRTWLFRMASRACIDYSRSKAYRERGSPEITEEMMEAHSGEPEVVALRQRELRVMWEALAALPPRQSMALYLKQVDGCSYDEIGRILGCPKSAVETLLFRARHGLSRTHERLQAEPQASCKMIGATMSAVLDKEGTPIQERAVDMHLSECRTCREEIAGMKRGVSGYVLLPMLPVGGQALSLALAGGTVGAGAGIGISRLIGMLLIKGQASGLAVAAIAAVTTAGVAGAAAGVLPSPIDGFGLVEDVGTAVRNATIGGGGGNDSTELKTLDQENVRLTGIRDDGRSSPQGLLPLPPGSQLDPSSAQGGASGLVGGTAEGAVENLNLLLGFIDAVLADTLDDPLVALQVLLGDPVGSVEELANDTTQLLNETTQNTTSTLDDTVDQTTDILDGVLGENGLTEPLDETIDKTTDVVEQTVGGATGVVDDTVGGATGVVDDVTDDLDETLDDIIGDDGLLGDGGLLGGPDEEATPPPEEEDDEEPSPTAEPPIVCTLLPILCP